MCCHRGAAAGQRTRSAGAPAAMAPRAWSPWPAPGDSASASPSSLCAVLAPYTTLVWQHRRPGGALSVTAPNAAWTAVARARSPTAAAAGPLCAPPHADEHGRRPAGNLAGTVSPEASSVRKRCPS